MDDKIKIPDKLPKELTDKYQVDSNTFKQEVKDNPKDRIQVEIGDSKELDFKPQVKIMRWDNEVNFSMRAAEDPNAVVEVDKEVIKYITPDYEVHQYDKPDASEDGGFEFEWILPKKPASNVLTATIQTKELDFFYQPALTQEEIDEGAIRPENVVGSYAVYHKTKGGMNDIKGMEYKTGKAFHIYRPKCIDANGAEIWGELNIDTDNGLLTVTVDQDFLDNAVYPVVVDPTFGYTTLGGTFATASDDMFASNQNSTPASNGTVSSVSIGVTSLNLSSEVVTGAIYVASDSSLLSPQTAEFPGDGDISTRYVTANFSGGPSITGGVVYYPTVYADGSANIMRDTGGASGDSYLQTTGITYPTFPDPATFVASTSKYSVYATYVAADTATGVTLCTFRPTNNEPPTSNFATYDTRNGHPCLDFDAGTDEAAVFSGVLPRSYTGGGITAYIHYSMATAVAGNVVITLAFERIGDGSQDIDSDSFATAISDTFSVPATSGNVEIAYMNFTDGAQIDSLAAGEKFRIKITRDANNTIDTATGDLELHGIELRETA